MNNYLEKKNNIILSKNNFNKNGINYKAFLNKKVNNNISNKTNSSINKDKNSNKESCINYKVL